jgi:hypothetical protein
MEKIKAQLLRQHLAALALAVFALMGTTAVGFIADSIFRLTAYGENKTCLVWGISTAICCFFMVLNFRISIWYAPIIINALFLFEPIMVMNFWSTYVWIPYFIGLILNVYACILALRISRKHKHEPAMQIKG